MADILPINIPFQGGQSIASYSWEDLTSKLGYINFYAGVFSGDSEKLVTQPFFSNTPETTTPFEGAVMDRTFTIEFGINRMIEGDVILQIPVVGAKGTAGAGTQVFTNTITIKKNSDTIGSGTITKNLSVPGGNVKAAGVASGIISVSNTKFNIGDTLSVQIATSTSGLSNTAFAGVCHDPSGTVSPTMNPAVTGALIIAFPFLLVDL
jgi:hypothetical protein